MIVYGSRMYFKKNVVRSFGECEHCGAYGKQVSYKARKFGHIYFIPLIPLGASSQVLRECKKCSMGVHISNTELEPIVDGLANEFKSWITAITEGQREIAPEPESEPLNIGAMVAGSLPNLYCLKEIESPDAITDLMDASGMPMEKELVLGKWNELTGDLEAARRNYEAAHRVEPESEYPLYYLGLVELKLGDIQAAESTFAKYLQIYPDDINVYIELAGAYEGTKNFPKIIETYDRIYDLNPAAIPEKAMKKVYKKACKKSGIEGKYLNQM